MGPSKRKSVTLCENQNVDKDKEEVDEVPPVKKSRKNDTPDAATTPTDKNVDSRCRCNKTFFYAACLVGQNKPEC
jgi:hypothetical protein